VLLETFHLPRNNNQFFLGWSLYPTLGQAKYEAAAFGREA